MDDSWRRLHPASVAVNLMPQAWKFLRGVWPIFLTGALGAPAAWDALSVDFVLFLIFLMGTLGSTLLHWATLRYRVVSGRLELESGFVRRQYRSIDLQNIENVERVHGILHRWFGVEEVRIETASGSEVEGLLSALSSEDAAALVQALRPHVRLSGEVLLRMTWPDVFVSAMVAPRWGFGVAMLGTGLSLSRTPEIAQPGSAAGWAILVLAWWGVSVVSAFTLLMFRYSSMVLRRDGDRLVAEGGWWTRWRTELPIARVQEVGVSQTPLQRLVGVSTWSIRTAALREGADAGSSMNLVLPMVYGSSAERLLWELVGVNSNGVVWCAPHPRGFLLSGLNSLLRTSMVAAAVATIMGGASWWLLALVPVNLLLASQRFRCHRWTQTPRALGVERGWPWRSTTWLSSAHLQSIEVYQGPLAAQQRIARVLVRVAGGGVSLPWVSVFRAHRVQLRWITMDRQGLS